jgi:hypothetical protein
MRRVPNWIIFGLVSIIIIAILIRLIKLYEFAVWGSDSGEHYFLITQLIKTGEIQLDYSGWGLAYPYFPGMHLLSSGFAQVSGCSSFCTLIYITPIIAGLSVIIMFCLALRVFRDPRVGLVAAGFLAVVMPHVFASSHPMPGSLGSFMLLACIFLLFKSYDNSKFLVLLILTSFALVLTHHMSTYFLIISVSAIILFRELLQHPVDLHRTRVDFGYLSFLITIALLYWLFYAIPFRNQVLSRGLPLSGWFIIPLAYLGLFGLYLIIHLRRRLTWQFQPKILQPRNLIIRALIFIIAGIVIISLASFTRVPGTDMKFDSQAVILFLPIIIFMSFLVIAPAFGAFYKDGFSILGWLIAICVSILFSMVTRSQELLSYRHLPYAFEAIALFGGLGAVKIFDLLVSKKGSNFVRAEDNKELIDPMPRKNTKMFVPRAPLHLRLIAVTFIMVILIFCGIYSYPPLNVLSGFEEGTNEEELEACFWARENQENDMTIASDHRLSSMMFGFAGLNSTWEYAPKTLHGESYDEIRSEVASARIPAGNKRIDYVIITNSIKEGVALEQWTTAQPMSSKAINKFESEPFIKLYDNGVAELYFINDFP